MICSELVITTRPQRLVLPVNDIFCHYRLADIVDPPRVVHELSWVNHHWPSDVPVEDVQFVRPEVQRYCLMGVGNSYTDFHVDFGGSSVWYHILRVREFLEDFWSITEAVYIILLVCNYVCCRVGKYCFG